MAPSKTAAATLIRLVCDWSRLATGVKCYRRHALPLAIWFLATHCVQLSAQSEPSIDDQQSLHHFENKIRPALIEHCIECHSPETELSGGLDLSSAKGWQVGGDLGPAVIPANASDSTLIRAIEYRDAKLQMPPDGKLPPALIAEFRLWVEHGALDPRVNSVESTPSASRSLSVQEAQSFWAYQPLAASSESPELLNLPPGATVDYWIDSRLRESGIEPASRADPSALVRRVYFDLTGLPPTPEQLRKWSTELTAERYALLVEELLSSPHYGETIARHWMDVVRYADSITLRGFVLPQAWRYRDYLIESFCEDRSFQQMIREQIAGDLLPAGDLANQQKQLVATGFLALGNTNLEQQDKSQLEMDYLDEQLDVMFAAFLGQTIGCARCHDHKFDPIPTQDYYALAGILKSSTGLKHANVSSWIELPLPQPVEQEAQFEKLELTQKQISQQLQQLKKQIESGTKKRSRFIDPKDLPGIVVDSSQATLVGEWTTSTFVGDIVGDSYLHDANQLKGQKSATFEPNSLPPGEYNVLLAYQSAENRATNVAVKVFSADGETELTVNQRTSAPEQDLWIDLGRYRFEDAGQKYVLVSNAGSDGHVVVDAVLFLPTTNLVNGSLSATLTPPSVGSDTPPSNQSTKLKELEQQLSDLQSLLDARPKYLTITEAFEPRDLPIHIRGSVHSLGDAVPRGFLTAITSTMNNLDAPPTRADLANWLCHDCQSLTARVYANRVWQWMMGSGIVSTPNNFGTTGSLPSHQQLLDSLAAKLIRSGWSTKSLVREIVLSQAYQRACSQPESPAELRDADNKLYWRSALKRLSVESLRDAMLSVSGELDFTRGGSTIRPATKSDYNYEHDSVRRSIYQPVFRNSLPSLYDEFDFGNPSVSIEKRSRSTVAPQALVMMQGEWVIERARQASKKYAAMMKSEGEDAALDHLYLSCLGRAPTATERAVATDFLQATDSVSNSDRASPSRTHVDEVRLEQLIQVLFASIDFRYLD